MKNEFKCSTQMQVDITEAPCEACDYFNPTSHGPCLVVCMWEKTYTTGAAPIKDAFTPKPIH